VGSISTSNAPSLRWHLQEIDPAFVAPLRRLDPPIQLERVGRWPARCEQEVPVRIARELVNRRGSLNRTIVELNEELEQRAAAVAPAVLVGIRCDLFVCPARRY